MEENKEELLMVLNSIDQRLKKLEEENKRANDIASSLEPYIRTLKWIDSKLIPLLSYVNPKNLLRIGNS